MTADQEYSRLVSRISFRLLQPELGRGRDRHLVVPRSGRDGARLVELPGAPIDVLNTSLPEGSEPLRETLEPVCALPRMSTFANAALINRAVAAMPDGHGYVNVGVWVGFSLLAGMAGNPDRACVGVDNFSQFGGPRELFRQNFERFRSPRHEFHELDYRDYFAGHDRGPIGVYFYDGDHSYANQREGLEIAEPFFGDQCIVLVDDTNWPDPHRATFDHIASSDRGWEVLLDRTTADNAHPTHWNGMLVLRTARDNRGPTPTSEGSERELRRPPRHYDPVAIDPQPPLVSLVLDAERSEGESLDAAIDAALAQSWEPLEVLVASARPLPDTEREDRVRYVTADDGWSSLLTAAGAAAGDLIAFADAGKPLQRSAVEIGLAFPFSAQFNTPPTRKLYERLERVLQLGRDITAVVPPGESFGIADGGIQSPNFDTRRHPIPFLHDADGPAPADEDAARVRVDELRDEGARFLVLAWPAFEWLDRYPAFAEHLRTSARVVLENERAIAFDLRA